MSISLKSIESIPNGLDNFRTIFERFKTGSNLPEAEVLRMRLHQLSTGLYKFSSTNF